ncbi:putative potassium transporter [Talaromyces proteolyticus]|uniref:Potassium transporter n=1 Tax=Talaromyces proteolyticus TaxID=1131652 RepID=A0AAD4KHC5_9EURO|nr:putative potassium transporter [Talaromyces proteolyticus]KAH8690454.1 putative potassium transporter [Talaromyces proteolyticus]
MSPAIELDSDVISRGGGVFSTRKAQKSLDITVDHKVVDEDDSILEKDVVDERDVRKKQSYSRYQTLWLAYQSIGVIYGDIGTSPLYVYSSTFSDNPSYDDLVGALSLVIWSLTIMVTIKYVLIVLFADDEGEGGTFALFTLISRYANLVERDPREARSIRIERHNTNEMHRPNKYVRSFIERYNIVKWAFKIMGVAGVGLLLADGVLTPAQSLLGAIQGATVVNPNLSSSAVIGASCAIIVLVYAIQPLGTGKLAVTFAPIVIIWLAFNLGFGIYNLVHYDASVFKAFSPYFAGSFLMRHGSDGWVALGGILLAFTGVEALFADLGAFNRQAVQLSWCGYAYPCLLIGYIGQAAYISVNPSAYANPFYLTVPPGMLWPSLVFAILACIVASQAVITGAFQLLSQIMKLSYFPQIKVVHVSKEYHGQVYIPFANWLLMIGTVVVTAVYTNTTNLGHAYGVCVILVTFLTTCMVTLVALTVWRLPVYIVLPIFLIFALWDGMFLSSALTKVPAGAWVTLMIAGVLTCIFVLWRFGKEEQWKSEAADNMPLSQVVHVRSNSESDSENDNSVQLQLAPALGAAPISRTNGLGIFFDKAGSQAVAPHVFVQFLQKFRAAPEFIVLFHLRPVSMPAVAPESRYTVSYCFASHPNGKNKVPIPNCVRLVVRYGYTDELITPDLGRLVADAVRTFLLSGDQSKDETRLSLSTLDRAYTDQVIYIMGKEQLRVKRGRNIFRWAFLSLFVWIRSITSAKVERLNVQVDRLVEVGFVKEI